MDTIRSILVFVPFYDTVPHQMKLRFRSGMPSDELMGQIQRQLEGNSEAAKEVKFPLESSRYVALLFDPRDNVLVPFERSTLELQSACTKVLLHRRQEEDDLKLGRTESLDSSVVRVGSAGVAIPNKVAPLPAVACESSRSLERERFERSNATMLHIVGQVLSELALRTNSNCELTDKTWPAMLAWAMEKEHTSMETLDPTVVDQFKKTLLSSLSRGERIRGPPTA